MSKQRSHTGSGGTGDAEVARLLRDLAVRERQLRDLTEQSLGFLEELAESRRLNGDRERLVERLGELERVLTDAKRRLRHAGGAVTKAATKGVGGQKRLPLEVVFWGEGSRAAAIASCAVRGKVPVSWVGLPDAVPADDVAKDLTTIVNRDARTPAQCWNLGMAATTADAVLFLGPGVRLQAAPNLAAALPANAALLCPRIERGGASELGLDQRDALLRLRARPAPAEGAEAASRVPWAAADAFVLRRAAFETIGSFDEGLLGTAALSEFTLRARRGNFDVLGVPGVLVVGGALAKATAAESALADRERMVVLATHRPDLLGQALADVPILWQMERAELPGYLAQLLARMPVVEGLAEQRSLLERFAFGLAQYSLPTSQVGLMVQAARIALLKSFADAATVVGREEFAAALGRAEAQRLPEPGAAFDALTSDVALCRGAAASTARVLEQTRGDLREIDAHRHEQSARAERAEGARHQTQQQLDHVQQWLREAQAELRQAHEARLQALLKVEEVHRAAGRISEEMAQVKRDRQTFEGHLQDARKQRESVEKQLQDAHKQRESVEKQLQEAHKQRESVEKQLQDAHKQRESVEKQLQEAHKQRESVEKQLQDANRAHEQLAGLLGEERVRAQQTGQKFDAAMQQHRDLEREFLATDKDLRRLHEQVGEMARIVGMVGGADPAGLQQRLATVHAQAQEFAATLHSAGAADAEQLLKRLDDLGQRLAATEQTVGERERWIALLLQEVTQRRLMPRQLQDHERVFVDRVVDRAGRTP